MTPQTKERSVLIGLLALACATFFGGIGWGLPSRSDDAFLFKSAPQPWSAADIFAAVGPTTPDPHRAADADTDPITNRDQIVWLNQTPKQHAEIIRRYRLYSYQPDEMLTLRAIAEMPATHFDPRMYQYGGLWFYPVGAMLRVAGALHLIDLRSDMAHYLDHPEAFARFYVVARAYSALWGLVGVYVVFRLARRFARGLVVPTVAATCFVLMPVVINGAHEAKPHLAGAVLTLAAVLAATRYAETGQRKRCLTTGLLCGLAAGMVLTAAVAFVVIPLMTLLRPDAWAVRIRKAALAIAVGVAAYCVTNPYVPINLIRDPALLRQNLGALTQAKAIVGATSDTAALPNAHRLIAAGASVILTNVGLAGVLVLLIHRAWWRDHAPAKPPALLLGVPAAFVLVQFLRLAAGKPGEFARFAILPDTALALCAVVTVSSLDWGKVFRRLWFTMLIALTALQGLAATAGFLEDAWARGTSSSRTLAAHELQRLADRGAHTLAVRAEPAPYSLPPIDLTHWKLLLLPANGSTPTGPDVPDVIVTPTDAPIASGDVPNSPYHRMIVTGRWPRLLTRLSWADKPFEILVRKDLLQ